MRPSGAAARPSPAGPEATAREKGAHAWARRSGAAGGASCGPDSRQHCRSAFGTGDELILVYVHFIDSGSLGLIFLFSCFTSSFDRSTDVWAV